MSSTRDDNLARFGYRFDRGGAHLARSMMLADLRRLFEQVPDAGAGHNDFARAILDDNCLGKRSARTRSLTLRHLTSLYALDPTVPIFRTLRYFWRRDPEGQALLACLVAYTRDAVLRLSAPFILRMPPDKPLVRQELEQYLDALNLGRFSRATLQSTAQNVSTTWTRAGHIRGVVKKTRAAATPTPGAATLALLMGYIEGARGELLFETQYTKLLDCPPERCIELKKLEGRFTIRVELSDADVDAVIRQVILAKKPDAVQPIEQIMQTNLGEISRQLASTSIGHRQEEIAFFPQDYPILPVRRRFWENTLRVLDQTGTDSQLRNQLSMIHKVIQTNLDDDLGHVIPADYLYFDSADKLLQARVLPRKVHERTMKWITGNDDQRLMARACGLVFLITKLAGNNNEVGIRTDVDTLADLLVEDLSVGSGNLRNRLPTLLDQCDLLMRVGDQYSIQTEESAAWNDEFLSQRNELANQSHRIEAERDDRIRRRFGELVKKVSLRQGESKVERDIRPLFDTSLPPDAKDNVYVWVRDEWAIDENSVRADARQAGNQSPTLFAFIPKRSADDLRHHLIEFKAATGTLQKRGAPNTAEGIEARAAMETTRQTAEGKIRELLHEAFSGARVFQGGGTEVTGNDLQSMILEGAEKAFQRLFPQFGVADHEGWGKVYANAKKGAPDALKAVGYDGEPAQNPVCKAILAHIGPGK